MQDGRWVEWAAKGRMGKVEFVSNFEAGAASATCPGVSFLLCAPQCLLLRNSSDVARSRAPQERVVAGSTTPAGNVSATPGHPVAIFEYGQ